MQIEYKFVCKYGKKSFILLEFEACTENNTFGKVIMPFKIGYEIRLMTLFVLLIIVKGQNISSPLTNAQNNGLQTSRTSKNSQLWNCPICLTALRCVDASKYSFYSSSGYKWDSLIIPVPSYDRSVYATFKCTLEEATCKSSDGVGVGEALNEKNITVKKVKKKCTYAGKNSEGREIYDCTKSKFQKKVEKSGALETCTDKNLNSWNCPICLKVGRCIDASKYSFYSSTGYKWDSLMTYTASYDRSVYATFQCSEEENSCSSDSGKGLGEALNEKKITVKKVEKKCVLAGRNNENRKIYDCSGVKKFQKKVEKSGALDSCT